MAGRPFLEAASDVRGGGEGGTWRQSSQFAKKIVIGGRPRETTTLACSVTRSRGLHPEKAARAQQAVYSARDIISSDLPYCALSPSTMHEKHKHNLWRGILPTDVGERQKDSQGHLGHPKQHVQTQP